MSIKKLGNKKYFIRVTKYINGRRTERKYTGYFATVGMVKNKERELVNQLTDLKEKIENQSRIFTWSKALDDYYFYSEYHHRIATYYNRRKILEAYTSPWKELEIDQITKAMVSELVNSLNYSVSYKREVLKYVRCVFENAIDNRKINLNPAKKLKIHGDKNSLEKANRLDAMTKQEVYKVLTYMNEINHEFYEIFFVTYMLGLRSSEAVALEFSDVDFEENKVIISKSWCRKKKGFIPPKNGKSRIIPMNSDLKKLLIQIRQSSEQDNFVLPRLRNWMNGGATKVLNKIQEDLAIKRTNYHSLRASFISHLLLNGVAIVKVQALVGHSDLKTTMRYIRLSGSDLNGGTDTLNFDEELKFKNVIKIQRT